MPFQINLHYVDADPHSTYMGETREERIEEFLEENDCPVLAMYEGIVAAGRAATGPTVDGPGPAVPSATGAEAFADGVDVSHLLDLEPGLRRRPPARDRVRPDLSRPVRCDRAITPS